MPPSEKKTRAAIGKNLLRSLRARVPPGGSGRKRGTNASFEFSQCVFVSASVTLKKSK